MQAKFISLLALTSIASILASPLETGTICNGQITVSEEFIGKDHNVKVEHVTCPDAASVQPPTSLEKRQAVNVCENTCLTNCFQPAGGGPDPNECHVIADALRFENQNTGTTFDIGMGATNAIVMTFSSCKTFFMNQALTDLSYCRNDWASVIDFVAPNCQATQNSHGGNCFAEDQRWFIQIQHS